MAFPCLAAVSVFSEQMQLQTAYAVVPDCSTGVNTGRCPLFVTDSLATGPSGRSAALLSGVLATASACTMIATCKANHSARRASRTKRCPHLRVVLLRCGADNELTRAGGMNQLDGLSQALRDALARFESEVSKPDTDINLARAAAVLSMHASPDMDPEEAVMQPLARLGEVFCSQLESDKSGGRGEPPLPESLRLHVRAAALCAFMEAQGFRGCPRTANGFYDADNSCMDKVLERRCGIPITLSLVYMEVGRMGGLELHGMNFPGHFLLGFGAGECAGLLDAFSNRTLTELEAAAHFGALYGEPVKLDSSWKAMPRLLKVSFLFRMVRNLQHVYERDGNFAQAAQVVQYARRLEVVANR